jgi:hypothetical protein
MRQIQLTDAERARSFVEFVSTCRKKGMQIGLLVYYNPCTFSAVIPDTLVAQNLIEVSNRYRFLLGVQPTVIPVVSTDVGSNGMPCWEQYAIQISSLNEIYNRQ